MSRFHKTNLRWLLPVVFASILLGLTLTSVGLRPRPDVTPQEIVLVAKDVSFRLVDRPDEPNPVLRLSKGRPVKLVVRNDEPDKVLHCFTIGGLDVGTSRDLATGESETIAFTPGDTGTFAYACLMHAMMAGTVIVQ
jgi:plastocyanin domain-containing protein